jgi:hypothetical protein
MAQCPNKSHPDWKALVQRFGEDRATELYIQNGYDIPNPNGNPKFRKITVKSSFGKFGQTFNFKNTLDSLNNHPQTVSEIIDDMNNKYPWVKLSKDGIIDKDGKYVDIPPGKKGMHYKSAVLSAIAYGNDASVETIPHEYAHEYIEMYLDTPIVQKAIKKYGSKENLVTVIGRKYTGRKMSNSFEKFLQDFWNMIRNTFGSQDVSLILTKSFAKNERLGEPTMKGSEIYNYQDIKDPLTNKKINQGIGEYNDNFKNNTSPIQYKSDSDIINKIKNDLNKTISDNPNEKFRKYFLEKLQKVTKLYKDELGRDTKYAGFSENLINKINTTLADEDSASKILNKINNKEEKLDEELYEVYKSILNINKLLQHKEQLSYSYISGQNLTKSELVNKESVNEIEKQKEHTDKVLKDRGEFLGFIAENINKVLKYVTNNRVWTKLISGGENTVVSNILHKALNYAGEKQNKILDDFEKIFKNINTPKEYKKGSTFDFPNESINQIEGDEFVLEKTINDTNINNIKLTKGEQLAIYLISRQKGGMDNLRDGIKLDKIKDRNINLKYKFKLTENQLNEIINKIKNDNELQNFIKEIDEAMDYSYNQMNKEFVKLNGYNLPKIKFYFPMYHGDATTSISKTKNIIDDVRSFRERTERGGAVRLADPFKVIDGVKINTAIYSAYAVPIYNAKKLLNEIKGLSMFDKKGFIESIEGTLNKIQDPGLLFSTQGEKERTSRFNKVANNFTVAMLGKNLGVVFKQQVSLATAKTVIDSKFINASGPSALGMSYINPIDLMKRLSMTGFKGGETMMPIEWEQITNHPDFEIMIKHPKIKARLMGMINRESGEAIMGKSIGEDKVKVPFTKYITPDKKPLYMTKSRLMMGITIMDTLTVMRLFNAVKLETESRMGESEFSKLSKEEIEEHNLNRLQEVIDKTQPTFDQTNRTALARDSNPITRALTMFSSASSKMAMRNIESWIDFFNNPTSENKKKLFWTVIHNALATAVMLTTIDLIWYGLRSGFDDDDWEKMPTKYAWSALDISLGSIQGLGTVTKMLTSRLDDNPWMVTAQDPLYLVVNETMDGTANVFKGNFDKAIKQLLSSYSKTVGLPVTPIINFDKIRKRLTEAN